MTSVLRAVRLGEDYENSYAFQATLVTLMMCFCGIVRLITAKI